MHPDNLSPLAPATIANIACVDGVKLATAAAQIKYAGRDDLMIMLFEPETTVAGVFTKSKCPSAPVDLCRENLAGGKARVLVVNSGNANAFTGKKGAKAVAETVQAAKHATGCGNGEVFAASTGVIGEPLDAGKIARHMPDLIANCAPGQWRKAAEAIMTTDTFPKLATRSTEIDGIDVTMAGIAKGAGMIAPDMATMLSFVATDAPISANVLQSLLDESVASTFNSITVDTDTSTSDTLLAFATGAARSRGAPMISEATDPKLKSFRHSFEDLLKDLALQVVSDGEGASKLIEVTINGASTDESAKSIAMAIANSPLVKTAVAGEDANWGRVVMALGKAGEPADRDALSIWFGDTRVAYRGERDPDYDEDVASRYMKNGKIVICADVGVGDGSATVWGCDLTKEYVAINGDYRS